MTLKRVTHEHTHTHTHTHNPAKICMNLYIFEYPTIKNWLSVRIVFKKQNEYENTIVISPITISLRNNPGSDVCDTWLFRSSRLDPNYIDMDSGRNLGVDQLSTSICVQLRRVPNLATISFELPGNPNVTLWSVFSVSCGYLFTADPTHYFCWIYAVWFPEKKNSFSSLNHPVLKYIKNDILVCWPLAILVQKT